MNFRFNFLFFTVLITCFFARVASAQSPVYLTAVNEQPRHTTNIIEPEIKVNTELSKTAQKKELIDYLKEVETGDISYNPARIKRLYYLANLLTRLRLYPLAMKCFLKTMQPESDSIGTDNLPITSNDDSVLVKQEKLLGADTDKEISSKPISDEKISAIFDDGKTAIAYALVFHVKQPVRGKRKIYKLANTGHTFITLIKYNSDSTYAAISYGFYPKKDNPLSATPLIPSTSSTFKDDSEHAWDEVLGKFISKRRFDKILALTR